MKVLPWALVLMSAQTLAGSLPKAFENLPGNEFSFAANARDVSVHCTIPEEGVVFTFVRVETESTVEELTVRRPWGKEYCDWLKDRVNSLLREGGTITVVGVSRTEERPNTDRDDQGKPPPELGKRSYFTSIFDRLINSAGECVGYFDQSCPRGTRHL